MKLRTMWTLLFLALGLLFVIWGPSHDSEITAEVKAKLAADDLVGMAKIEVFEARNGVVTLQGSVESEDARRRALALARATAGVVNVVDMLAAQLPVGDRTAQAL